MYAKKSKVVIVSRHEATIKYLLTKYPEADVKRESVSYADIKDYDIIIGNLPLSIISQMRLLYSPIQQYINVEWREFPPRGVEINDIEKYGISLKRYVAFQYKNWSEFLETL